MIYLDYEGSGDEETELPPEIFGCAQETRLKDVPLMAPEFPSLVEGGDVDMREIESIHRTSAGCLAEDNLRWQCNWRSSMHSCETGLCI